MGSTVAVVRRCIRKVGCAKMEDPRKYERHSIAINEELTQSEHTPGSEEPKASLPQAPLAYSVLYKKAPGD